MEEACEMLKREARKQDARAAFAPLSVLLCLTDLSNNAVIQNLECILS